MGKQSHTIRINNELYTAAMMLAARRTLDSGQQVTVRDVIEELVKRGLEAEK